MTKTKNMTHGVDELLVPVNPVSAPRMTQRDKWAKRPAVVKYFAYRDAVRAFMNTLKFKPGDNLDVTFHLEMPKSWSGAKRSGVVGKPHQQKPDIDNLLKGLMDAMFEEDCRVHTVTAKKVWADWEGFVEIKNVH